MGRRLRRLIILTILFLMPLIAAQAKEAPPSVILVGGKVTADKCKPCHLDFDAFKNPNLIFRHSFHILVRCKSCHFTFPHLPAGIVKPPMEVCFNCHGLKHGPRGLVAKSACLVCHNQKKEPKSHSLRWKRVDHRDENPSFCVICHSPDFCEDCHARAKKKIKPIPQENYLFPGFLPESRLYLKIVPSKMGLKNGCYACHSDERALKLAGASPGAFIERDVLESSLHASVSCVRCHSDFNYFTEVTATVPYSYVAGLACRNCHDKEKKIDHREQFKAYQASIHGERLLKDANFNAPTCGSCHGGHAIRDLRKPEEKLALKREGYQVCGRCHQDYWDSYDDWYHGRAYKMKASDAPACWDCHGSHDIVPKSKASSRVNDKNLAETCGKCHRGSTKEFTKYGQVVHARQEVWKNNLLYKLEKTLIDKAKKTFKRE